MSSTTKTFASIAESIKVKNTFTLNINSQFLDMNFQLIKQCLTRLQDLETSVNKDRNESIATNREIYQRLNYIQKDISNHSALIGDQEMKIKDLKENIGEDFKRKIDQLEQKSRNMHDLDKLVKQIQALNRFVSQQNFKEFQAKTGEQLKSVNKIRDQFGKYVDNENFKDFKDQTSSNFDQTNNNLNRVQDQTNKLGTKIIDIDNKATKAVNDVQENNNMMKQINFNDMQLKLKKYKEESEAKLNEMVLKLKKKVGTNQLADLEKNIIDKLDGYLLGNQKAKADREETKEALSFLQKRINEIFEMFSATQDTEQTDPLFMTKKWMCASCTKDLGKVEGKLGQFKPWSVFPCRELDPEKTGGYGYLNYVDKMAYKKGFVMDDTGLERLNKTFFEKNSREGSPKKMQTTRATNFMSNYGIGQKNNTASLKDEYFKPNSATGEKQKGAKFFRVKNTAKRQSSVNDPQKQKVKQV